jgi:hypothetical protein
VLDVLDRLLTDLLARVDRQEQHRRLRTIGDLVIRISREIWTAIGPGIEGIQP